MKGRATVKVNADCGRQQIYYRRVVAGNFDVDFDAATGLVAQRPLIEPLDIEWRQEFVMTMKLTAVFKRVPEGYIAFIKELPGANTQGIHGARDFAKWRQSTTGEAG